MSYILKITVEGAWRGPILDTVLPVAEFPLISRGSSGLQAVPEKSLITLADGSSLTVCCSVTQSQDIKFSLTQNDVELLALSTHHSFYMEMRLQDEKLYFFKLTKSNQLDQVTQSAR